MHYNLAHDFQIKPSSRNNLAFQLKSFQVPRTTQLLRSCPGVCLQDFSVSMAESCVKLFEMEADVITGWVLLSKHVRSPK